MSKLSGGASYLNKESVPAKRLSAPKKSPVMVAVSAFFALLVLFMSSQPILSAFSSNAPHKAEAGAIGLFCTSHIGLGMDDKSDWSQFLRVYPLPSERNRVWTLQEAFGSGLSFVNYEGEGGKDKDLIIEKSPANTFKPGNYDTLNEKLEGIRGISSCFTAGGLNYVANGIMGLANIQSNIVQAFTVFAFDSNIICSDAANPTGACLNLLKVIGGTGAAGSGGGLIGTLTSSIYMPLLVIAVTIVGLWVGYKGLVQRKLREAMFGAIWVCLSAIFGLALLLNPSLLAKAPMAVSNAVATCVIGSFNGQNCMDDTSGTASLTTDNFSTSSDKICRSLAPGAALDAQMSMTVNSLSCSIWKAFVLEPYAQGSFGTSFGNLDTVANTPTKKVIEKAGIDPNTFCVNLGSSESLQSFDGKRAVFDRDSGKVCNLLAYQMFLKTNASTTGSTTPASDAIDSRWYNVVVTAANDEGLWAQWAPSPTNSMHKIATSMLAGFTGLVGGIVLIVIAFFALVYYLTSVILMAFAPLFFLLGVHPGRGKKILLGWLEKVVSNVLKYLASAMFLIVSISFYAAILGAASSPALTFLFVIIVSGALIMYRKEIVDLIGKASMGGEQLSNSFSEKLKEKASGVGSLALAGAGSGLGAAIAGGRVSSGIKAGIQRDLQRGGASKILGKTGGELVSNATRQFARNTVDNERDVKEEARRAQAQLASDASELQEVEDNSRLANEEITKFDVGFISSKDDFEDLKTRREKFEAVENEAAREMMADNPYFAQAQMIANQIAGLEFEKKIAIANGDKDAVDLATAEIQQLRGQRETLLGAIDSTELKENRDEYQSRVSDKLDRQDLHYTDKDDQSLVRLSSYMDNAQATRDNLVESANDLIKRKSELEISTAGLRAKEETLNTLAKDIQPGDMVTRKKADAMLAQGDAAAESAIKGIDTNLTYIPNRSLDDVYGNPQLGPEDDGGRPSAGPSGPPSPTGGSGGGDRGPSTPTGPVTPSPQAPVRPTDPSPVAPTTPTAVLPEVNNAPTDRVPVSSNSGNASTTPEANPGTENSRRASGLPTSRLAERLNAVSGENSEVTVADAAPTDTAPRPAGIPTSQGRRSAAAPVSNVENNEPVIAPSQQPQQRPAQPAYAPTVSVPDERPAAPANPPQPNRDPRPQPAYVQPQTPTAAPQPAAQGGIPTAPTRAPQSAAPAPEARREAPRVENVRPKPEAAPTIQDRPAPPVQAPRIPEQPKSPPASAATRREARADSPRTETPRVESVSTPAPPVQAPKVPAQPSRPPVVSAPEVKPAEVQAQPTRLPVKPANAPTIQERATAPAPPTREPAVPRQPDREPATPRRNQKEERQAPLAREIKLPSAPRVSRVTENSDLPDFKVQKENKSDNESPTQGFGIPRRRNSKND